jgi:hypothetical protein
VLGAYLWVEICSIFASTFAIVILSKLGSGFGIDAAQEAASKESRAPVSIVSGIASQKASTSRRTRGTAVGEVTHPFSTLFQERLYMPATWHVEKPEASKSALPDQTDQGRYYRYRSKKGTVS